MVEIRLGKKEDFEEIYRMGKAFMETSDLIKSIGWERQSVKKLVDLFVENQSALGLVAEEDGKLVGMLGLLIAPHLFNNNVLVAEEIAWWVEPEYRKKIGFQMLDLVEKILEKRGIKHFGMKFLSNENLSPEIMERMYARRGYKKTETIMTKGF